MKKILIVAAIVAGLTGCASIPSPTDGTPAQNMQRVVTQFCPIVQAINTQIMIDPSLPQNLKDEIAAVSPMTDKVCTANSTVSIVDLKSLSVTAIPALLDVVAKSTIGATPAGQALLTGLSLVKIVIAQVQVQEVKP